jgi:hypothetical protein
MICGLHSFRDLEDEVPRANADVGAKQNIATRISRIFMLPLLLSDLRVPRGIALDFHLSRRRGRVAVGCGILCSNLVTS